MNAFIALAKKIESNNNIVFDDELGEEIKLYGVGHVIQNHAEHAVALFKDQDFYLRGLYVSEEDDKVHLDHYTTGGAIYAEETPDLVDLQHHPVMYGTLFQTYIFGMENGGCKPRPAPEKEEKKADDKKDAEKKNEKKTKKDEPKQATYNAPRRHALGLGSMSLKPSRRAQQEAQVGPQQQA